MSRRLLLGLAALPAAALLALGVLACVSRRTVELGLVEGRLRDCPGTPNCVCSEGTQPSIEPLRFTGPPDAAFAHLLDLIAAQPRAAVLERTPDYAHATFRSAFWGFVDDVELRLDRAAAVIQIRSASRVGRSDLGVNRARVERLRTLWKAGE